MSSISKIIKILVFISSTFNPSRSATTISVSCEYDEAIWSHNIGSSYYCFALNPKEFIGDALKVTSVTGLHQNGHSIDDVSSFFLIQAEKLTKFPINLSAVFTHLRTIRISYSGLTMITEEDLKPLPELRNLWLDRNKLRFLRHDTFMHNSKLEVVVMRGNLISLVDPMTFSSLRWLKSLDLSENKCRALTEAQNRDEVERLMAKIDDSACTLN